jgi:hypothetical protein
MRMDMKAMALAMGCVFGFLVLFLTGLANMIWPGYGQPLLDMAAALYPGYSGAANFGQVIVGSLYAFVDGCVFGILVSFFYNRFAAGTPADTGAAAPESVGPAM